MRHLRPHLARVLLLVFFVGWYVYPGWYFEYYSTFPEKYAYPASLSNPHDPPWGFWFW